MIPACCCRRFSPPARAETSPQKLSTDAATSQASSIVARAPLRPTTYPGSCPRSRSHANMAIAETLSPWPSGSAAVPLIQSAGAAPSTARRLCAPSKTRSANDAHRRRAAPSRRQMRAPDLGRLRAVLWLDRREVPRISLRSGDRWFCLGQCSRTEVGEYCEDAAVVGVGGGQAEFGENGGDVLLDGSGSYHQARRDG